MAAEKLALGGVEEDVVGVDEVDVGEVEGRVWVLDGHGAGVCGRDGHRQRDREEEDQAGEAEEERRRHGHGWGARLRMGPESGGDGWSCCCLKAGSFLGCWRPG